MKLKWITAAVLAVSAFSASAANQSFTITPGTAFSFEGLGPLLSSVDGSDTLTFTGIGPGTYKALLSYSSVNVDITKARLNELKPVAFYNSSNASLGTFNVTDTSPFTLQLWGLVTGNPVGASYNGQITIVAVPEPETYGMLLGGLALLGVAARRRKQS